MNDPQQDDSHQQPHQIRMNKVTARVPEGVGRGVFSTGAIVMSGPNELLIDFIQQMGRPHNVVARIVLPLNATPQVIGAIERNLKEYQEKFGQPKELPKPNRDGSRPSIQDVYDNFKLPDEMLSGSYANAVLIGFTAAEFSFDFVTNFFPHPSVSNRVFLSAPHVAQLLESLKTNFKQLQQRFAAQRANAEQQRPPQPPFSDGQPEPSSEPG